MPRGTSCGRYVTIRPFWMLMMPSDGSIAPVMTFMSVLLPAPLRPSMATRSPGSSWNVKWSRTLGPPNATVISCRLMSAIVGKF